MVDYVLTVQSEPTGIEVKVQTSTESKFRVTNFTETYPDGTVITLIAPAVAGEPQGTTEKNFYFKQWKDNGNVIGTNPNISVTLSANTTRKAYYEQQKYFPTRPPTYRGGKFEAKEDEEVIKLRTQALKTMMVEQQAETTAQQTTYELRVGTYLNSLGLYGMTLHHYRNFSQELYGLTRLFTGATLNKEASLKAEKWRKRLVDGTNPDETVKERLTNIAKLFGITLTFT